jgi:hypothetical protein
MLLASYWSAKLPFGFSTRKLRPVQDRPQGYQNPNLLSRRLFGRGWDVPDSGMLAYPYRGC